MLQFSSVLALALLGCSAASGAGEPLDGRDPSERSRGAPTATEIADAGCEHQLAVGEPGLEAWPQRAAALVFNPSNDIATVKLTRGGELVDIAVVAPGESDLIGLPGLHRRTAERAPADPTRADRPTYRFGSDAPIRVYKLSNASVEEETMQQQTFLKLGVTLVPLMLIQPTSTGCASPTEAAADDDGSTDDGSGGHPDLAAGGGGGSPSTSGGGSVDPATTSSTGGTGSVSSSSTAGTGGQPPDPTCDAPDPNQCNACQQCAATTQCKSQYDACTSAPDCTGLSTCLTACNADPTCEDTCLTRYPTGAPLLEAAANCLYCTACPASCNLCN